MHSSAEDGSQRMLNALEPGTILPIHLHTRYTETVVLIRGSVRQNYYNPTYSGRYPVTIPLIPVQFSMAITV